MDNKQLYLLSHCVELLSTYDEKLMSMEEHVDHYLQLNKIYDEDDEIFIKEVSLGSLRHSGILKVVTEGFYIRDGKNVLRSNENLFIVIIYLALFRLKDLGLGHFQKFVSILDTNIAYKLLNFMFDEKNILSWNEGWNKVYDPIYIQVNLLSPLLRWLPELKDLVKFLKNRNDNKHLSNITAKLTTEIKPFSLTKPKARMVPIPDMFPKLTISKQLPKPLYLTPAALEKQKEGNRKKAECYLLKPEKLQSACADPQKFVKNNKIIHNTNLDDQSKVDSRLKAKSVPDFRRAHKPVKMTSAAIMREGLLYQKKETDLIKKLRNLEDGASDYTKFHKWQTERKQQDLEKNLLTLKERRLLGKLSYEEAILAYTNMVSMNHRKVQSVKKETAAMMKECLDQKIEKEKEMKILVDTMGERHKIIEKAREHMKENKQKIAQEVKAESRDLMKQTMKEAESEMRYKSELIQQIRAMQATPIRHMKMVESADTPGTGLLGEMSIVELQEKLSILKAQKNVEEELKRDNIMSNKQSNAELISATMDMIVRHRAEQMNSRIIKCEQHKNLEHVAAPIKNEDLSKLERKFQEKKAERLRTQQKMKLLSSQASTKKPTIHITQKVWKKYFECG